MAAPTHKSASARPSRFKSSSKTSKRLMEQSAAAELAQQAKKLSHQRSRDGASDVMKETKFTPKVPFILPSDNNRLPAVPLAETHKLIGLKQARREDTPEGPDEEKQKLDQTRDRAQSSVGDDIIPQPKPHGQTSESAPGSFTTTTALSHTNPLFPPLPLYGPPSILHNVQCRFFRASSFCLSLAFLGVIVLGSLLTMVPPWIYDMFRRLTFRNPDTARPFYHEELRRQAVRRDGRRKWNRRLSDAKVQVPEDKEAAAPPSEGLFAPTEGGPDALVCDVGYYARRVGLDVETFEVQTEDGFLIELWHVYDPREYGPLPETERRHHGPGLVPGSKKRNRNGSGKQRFPVLLMHGLLQSSGAYCVNDDDSLAFFLCKSGFDVWLGNNRCGFRPRHVLFNYSDPRMWCWNIQQMGVFDLAALTSRVLYETGFEKLGLVAHSQGTTQTFVALAKDQYPELGEKLTVFCALAPAAYAGPLIGKVYFKFMRIITTHMFRLVFGIHAFIPLMMTMHARLEPHVYGWLGYHVFSFLFNWTDRRWDRGLRNRMFQFAPVFVSAESMRWWLGRECFARHKCILSTKDEWRAEEQEDLAEAVAEAAAATDNNGRMGPRHGQTNRHKGSWYNHQAPPFAFWVCGNDALVDGSKLLRRFERGREPHVRVVHAKVIPEYEHLDVIWAMDAPEQVFKEVREVLWRTCNARARVRVPKGCEDVEALDEWECESTVVATERRAQVLSSGSGPP